jgi:hypothetical protein
LLLKPVQDAVNQQPFRIWAPSPTERTVWAQVLVDPSNFLVMFVPAREALAQSTRRLVCLGSRGVLFQDSLY